MESTMTSRWAVLLMGAMLLVTAASALADWDPGDPHIMDAPQLPDLNNGMDVLCMFGEHDEPWYGRFNDVLLSDDFRCTRDAPITEIHIWGSWLDDQIGELGLAVAIQSTPGSGDCLWWRWWGLPPEAGRVYGYAPESFYDPQFDEFLGTDTQVWQYNLTVDPEEAFRPQPGQTYWLTIQQYGWWESAAFGWKTCAGGPWGSPAVWMEGAANDLCMDLYTPHPLSFPAEHPYAGRPIDFAFAIVPEPASVFLLAPGVTLGLILRRHRAIGRSRPAR